MNMHMLTEIAGGYVSAISRSSSDSTLVYILIISILLTELMVVVIVLLCKIKRQADEREDYNVGYRDNDASQNAVDARLLDKETIIEAIRSNGYTSNIYDDSIEFSYRGNNYIIPVDRLPIIAMVKIFVFDPNVDDIDLMHKAAHQVSDEMVIAKVLFSDNKNKVYFQISAIENKYGHFRDCLPKYVEIIDEAQSRFVRIYNDLGAKSKEELTTEPRIENGESKRSPAHPCVSILDLLAWTGVKFRPS